MRIFKPKLKLALYLFYFLAFSLSICACGKDVTLDVENKRSTTGSYQPVLIFPGDIPREDSTTQAITGIDCKAAKISAIEFTFIVKGSPHGPYACEAHKARIMGIPVGTGIRVSGCLYL
jgi:hypothetical protein